MIEIDKEKILEIDKEKVLTAIKSYNQIQHIERELELARLNNIHIVLSLNVNEFIEYADKTCNVKSIYR